MEDRTVMRKVTFKTGLPNGTHATFKENDELWIAVPAKKWVAVQTVSDRLLGALWAIRSGCIYWINQWPTDAVRVTQVLEIIDRATNVYHENAMAKVKAHTS